MSDHSGLIPGIHDCLMSDRTCVQRQPLPSMAGRPEPCVACQHGRLLAKQGRIKGSLSTNPAFGLLPLSRHGSVGIRSIPQRGFIDLQQHAGAWAHVNGTPETHHSYQPSVYSVVQKHASPKYFPRDTASCQLLKASDHL